MDFGLSDDQREIQRTARELLADRAKPDRVREHAEAGTSWSYEFLRARGNTIEGGTTEVLKNIVAERVLGLPRLKAAA